MYNVLIEDVDHLPWPIIVTGNSCPDGHVIAPHRHRRGQLSSSASGVFILTTDEGTWVMPPQRGLWIPSTTKHRVRSVRKVNMQSLYLEPKDIPQMPRRCQAVGISPFMRGLLTEALNLPHEYDFDGRAGALMELIRHEMQQMPILPLALPFSSHGALATRCCAFVQQPNVRETIDDWSAAMGMSRRTFTRFFKQKTGHSFMHTSLVFRKICSHV